MLGLAKSTVPDASSVPDSVGDSTVFDRRLAAISPILRTFRTDSLAGWFNGHAAIVRSMPNRPALIGCGITALFAGAGVDAAGRERAAAILAAVGEYVLQLVAFDGEYAGSDTITINVYNDSCEAAQSLPDYAPLVGDLNGDCRVDDDDFTLLQENWLKDNSLTEDWLEIGGL